MDLLIDTYGTKIGATGERIALTFPNVKEKKEYPIHRIDKILILRAGSLSTDAAKLALDHDVDIVYLGSFGKPIGRLFSSEPKGLAGLRRAQLEISNSEKSLEIAKILVKGKCTNQISYIRSLGHAHKKDFSREILQMESILKTIEPLPNIEKSKEQLLGIEGYTAERYFSCLKKLHTFSGRKPEARDKFNSALNYGYGMLYNEVDRACLYTGLDPNMGLYHSERYGKPALVLDLVEEFRVPIVDSVVFPLFLEKKITQKGCFDKTGPGEYQLSQKGKKFLIEAVVNRLNESVVWNGDGKRYSLKTVIENQVRGMARHFMGKEEKYIPFDMAEMLQLRPEVLAKNSHE